MQSTSIHRTFGVLLLATLMAAASVAIAPTAGAMPGACSVSGTDGGIDVSWGADPAAALYVYRLEVAGENNRYNRVTSTSTFLALGDGQTGTVFVSSVAADGSYSPSVACGSGSATEGTGTENATCTASDATGGIDVIWSAVDNADIYVYRLETSNGPNRYNRVNETQTRIPLLEGVVGTVFVSARFADGSYSPATACGSAQAIGGTGVVPFTCSLGQQEGIPVVNASWTDLPDAGSYVVRIEAEGQPNRYRNTRNTSVRLGGDSGQDLTLAVTAFLSGGGYVTAACGTVTFNLQPNPSLCTAVIFGNGDLLVSWPFVQGGGPFAVTTQVAGGEPTTEVFNVFSSATIGNSSNVTAVWVESNGGAGEGLGTSCSVRDAFPPDVASCRAVIDNNGEMLVNWTEAETPPFYTVTYQRSGDDERMFAIVQEDGPRQLRVQSAQLVVSVWVIAGSSGPIGNPVPGTPCELVGGAAN